MLQHLGRGNVILRYVIWLGKLYDEGRITRSELAFRLWATWRPKSAIEVLGGSQNWQIDAYSEISAFYSLIELRRFVDAGELYKTKTYLPNSSPKYDLMRSTLQALKDQNVTVQPGQDIAAPVLEHLLDLHRHRPAPTYSPQPGRVLVYSHALGVSGAEPQVTNLLANLLPDDDVSALDLVVREKLKTPYKVAENNEKLLVHQFLDMPKALPTPWDTEPALRAAMSLGAAVGLNGVPRVLGALYELRPETVFVRGGLFVEIALAAVLAGVPRIVVQFGSVTSGKQSSGSEVEEMRTRLVKDVIALCAEFPQVVLAADSRPAADDWAEACGLDPERIVTISDVTELRPNPEIARVEQAREDIVALLQGREWKAALKLCREICQSEQARPLDYRRRTQLLQHMGRGNVIQRYVGWLGKLYDEGRITRSEYAFRLWASWRPKSAIEVLGGSQNWQTDPSSEISAYFSLIELRRFVDAGELYRTNTYLPKSGPKHDLVRSTLLALKDQNVAVQPGQDIAMPVLEHLLDQHRRRPAPKYAPQPGRVLVYTHSLGIGGAERQVTHLLANLLQDDDVSALDLLVKEQPKSTYKITDDNEKFSIHQFSDMPDTLPAPWDTEPALRAAMSLGASAGLHWVPPLLGALYELRPEIVHVRGGLFAEVALAAVLAGVPRIVVQFGSMTRGQQSSGSEVEDMRTKLVENVIARCAEFPQVVLAANSRAAADDWAEACGLDPERIITIYNAIEPGELGFRDLAPFDTTPTRPLTVGGVFRLAPVKDPLLWAEVARKVNEAIPGTRFLLVGDGPLRSDFENAIALSGLSDQVELPGLIFEGLFDYLERMDLFLMTTRTESLPNAVIEAQLAGLPVVAPDVGGISEAAADEKTAKLVARDADALAEAVIDSLRDTEWRAQIYANAPELIMKRFSRHAQLQAVKSAYGWL